MEVLSSSETSVDFDRTTRRYIPENMVLHQKVTTFYFQRTVGVEITESQMSWLLRFLDFVHRLVF
jgi:hypothetical protein